MLHFGGLPVYVILVRVNEVRVQEKQDKYHESVLAEGILSMGRLFISTFHYNVRKVVYWLNAIGTPYALLVSDLQDLVDGVVLWEITNFLFTKGKVAESLTTLKNDCKASSFTTGNTRRKLYNIADLLQIISDKTSYKPKNGVMQEALAISMVRISKSTSAYLRMIFT